MFDSFNSRSLLLKTPAKINLYLNILRKRKDSYHDICSIMERVSFFDELRIALNDTKKIRFFCNLKSLNHSSNLVFKAAQLIQREFGLKQGLDIFLKKNILPGWGLGGASSNAAGTLLGLNTLLGLGLSFKELCTLGAKLGSDVNFFLSQSKFSLVLGRGEEVYPIETNLKLKHTLILPDFSSSTRKVYKAYRTIDLTSYLGSAKLIIYSLEKEDQDLIGKLLFNGLTKAYLKTYRKAQKIFEFISQTDACFSLTGSGSSLFLLEKAKPKREFLKSLKKLGVKLLGVTTF